MPDKIKGLREKDPFIAIRPGMIRSDLLDHYEKLCFIVLKMYANNETMRAFPSFRKIAKLMGCGRSTAIKAIDGLVEKGILIKEPRYREDHGRSSNLYTLIDSRDIWNAGTEEELKKLAAETEIDRSIRILKEAGYKITKEKEPMPEPAKVSDISSLPDYSELNYKEEREKSQGIERYPMDLLRDIYDYKAMVHDHPDKKDAIDAIMGIIYDLLNSKKELVRIAGEEKPLRVVASKLLKLDMYDIVYVIDQYSKVNGKITNHEGYILTMLYKAKIQQELHIRNQISNVSYEK